MGTRTESMRAPPRGIACGDDGFEASGPAPLAKKRTFIDEAKNDYSDSGATFWGTRRPMEGEPVAAAPLSPVMSPRARQSVESRKSMLRYSSHRSGLLEDLSTTGGTLPPDLEPEPPAAAKKKEVKRDLFGKRIYDGPKYIPGDRGQKFNPAHVNREVVFKEDLARALKGEDLQLLLAVFSGALDLDAKLHNTTLMYASRHDIEAIKKKLRRLLKKTIETAMKDEDVEALRRLYEQIDKDKLMDALTKFPEVYRGRCFLKLRLAQRDLEQSAELDAETKSKKVQALRHHTRRAKKMAGLDDHVTVAENVLAHHEKGLALPLSPSAADVDESSPEPEDQEAEIADEEVGEDVAEDVAEDLAEEPLEAGELEAEVVDEDEEAF